MTTFFPLVLLSFRMTMASFPIQAFGTTTWPLFPDGGVRVYMKYKLDRSTVMMEEMMITEMIIVVMALWTSVLMALWTSKPINTSILRKSSWKRCTQSTVVNYYLVHSTNLYYTFGKRHSFHTIYYCSIFELAPRGLVMIR